jgi:glycosyltransferase involved in cell wall biosynthesis
VISVVMPVRDGADFLGEAIDSVLTQTERALELIVVDDASSDDTPRVLEQVRDERLRILRNDERRGIAGSLNRGLAIARGTYVARMDADDVALPHRLRTQREFLEANPRIALCGTHVRMFAGDWHRDVALETHPERIRCALLLFNVVSHPTAMWRRDGFERHGLAYDETFENSEDYDLWCRASHCVGIGNVPEVLLRYRVHPAQAGNDRAVRMREGTRVRKAQLARLGAELGEEEWKVHEAVGWADRQDCLSSPAARRWMETLLDANERTGVYRPEILEAFLRGQLDGAVDERRRAAVPRG